MSGSFVIPTNSETSTSVWYHASTCRSQTRADSPVSFRDVTPRTVLRLRSEPASVCRSAGWTASRLYAVTGRRYDANHRKPFAADKTLMT